MRMAKLSISIPDDLVDELRDLATSNVSAFVATAIRHEVDRRRLFGFLDELEQELGLADDAEVAYYVEQLTGGLPAIRAAEVQAAPETRPQTDREP
jgi:post-segregation antitoxin (ccd killing protein)